MGTGKKDYITYEQPANELVRACLRLEHLFSQFDWHMKHLKQAGPRNTIKILTEILTTLDRPDLKSKFTQEFHRLITVFSRLNDAPDISQTKLKDTLKNLRQLLEYLIGTHGKIAQSLRSNEFLSTIQAHLLTPGGDCSFETPGYHYWLQQPTEAQQADLTEWVKAFDHIRAATDLLLNIARHSAEQVDTVAEKGFYHGAINPQVPAQLVRVTLPKETQLYPEISLGKHRMNIRFYIPTTKERPHQTSENVTFQLMTCNI